MPAPIRVLHLIHHLDVGGAEMLLAGMLPRFDRSRFDVSAACIQKEGALYRPLAGQGVALHNLNKRPGLDVGLLRRLCRLLKDEDIAILHTHGFSARYWGRIASALSRTPHTITTYHASIGWHKPLKHVIIGALLPRPDRAVAVSEEVKTSLIRYRIVRPERMAVIPNGVCLDRPWAAEIAGAAWEWRPTPGRRVLGVMARCSPEKGGDCFIRALAELCRRGRDVEAYWVGDGPYREPMKRIAAEAGVGDRMHFPGVDLDVLKWLKRFDVVVCPSRREGFGLSALEAQAAGAPVAATRAEGLAAVLSHERDALLAPVDRPGAMADAVERLLTDPELAGRLVRRGLEKMERCYSIEATVRQYEALYEVVSAGRKPIVAFRAADFNRRHPAAVR